jgi:hypothetical protein
MPASEEAAARLDAQSIKRFDGIVMPALVAGIHVLSLNQTKTWMAGTSPAMTGVCFYLDKIMF